MHRRQIAGILAVALLAGCGGGSAPVPTAPADSAPPPSPPAPAGPPNFVIIVADDLGYGDVSSFGATRIKTPNLDRLASEGVRLTTFTVPAPICAAARASLLTGRYPVRNGIVWNPPKHLDGDELTLGDALRPDYMTYLVGKWHLGYEFDDFPLQHGFDYFYGVLDNSLPFMRGNVEVKDSYGDELITRVYTEEAVQIIRAPRDRPFLLYIGHRSPHAPLAASADFFGRSQGGLYGDVVEELDWGVGEVVKALRETGLDRNTLVFFTSDNGPWIAGGAEGGSAGPFRGGKGSPLEGGLRQPTIAWWPGRIPGGRSTSEPTSVLDIFPTMLALAGVPLRADRNYDGQDIQKLLTGEASHLPGVGVDGSRELLAYISRAPVAIRAGKWKYLTSGFWAPTPALYDLDADPGESNELQAAYPDVAKRMAERLEEVAADVATTK